MKEWKELYDSGYTESTIIAFDEVDISGYSEIYGIIYSTKNEEATGSRDVQLKITTGEKEFYGNVGTVIANTGGNRSCYFNVKKICDSINVVSVFSANSSDPFEIYDYNASSTKAGFGCGYDGDLATIEVRSLNKVADYEFGIGSRCRIYGR